MKQDKTVKLVTSAMMIAVGTVLSLVSEWIPFLNLPFGGTITLASTLPVILISYCYGIRWGLGTAFVYSLLQMAVGFRTVSALFLPDSDSYMGLLYGACILLLDYVLAFTSLGVGGLFRNKKPVPALIGGTVLAIALRYLFHVLSGAIFYGAWAEWFFLESEAASLAVSKWVMATFDGWGLSLAYSVVYNALYMLPEGLLTALAAGAVAKLPRLKKL